MKHSLFSFFSGAGFLDLGFEENVNFTVKFTNEIHPPFRDAYIYGREALNVPLPEFGNYDGSITELITSGNLLPNLIQTSRTSSDLIGFLGGPPCPDFSVGGKNKGRQGDKGALSEAYIELILQQQPDYFLFENVKGLWRTKKHRAFYEELKQKLRGGNYILTERLINAIEYGVPQDRERIILLGFHQDTLANLGIAISRKNSELEFPWDSYRVNLKEEIFKLNWPETSKFEEDSDCSIPEQIIEHLTVEHWFKRNDTSNHPNAIHHFKPRSGLPRFQSVDEGDDSRKSFKRLHRWRYSPTAAYGNNEVHLHPYKVRRISAAEALAIQSLPKGYSLPPSMSLTNMFKTIGNGVPYLASKALAASISDFLEIQNEQSRTIHKQPSTRHTPTPAQLSLQLC